MTKDELIKALTDCPLPGDTPVHFNYKGGEVPETAKLYQAKLADDEDWGWDFADKDSTNPVDAIVLDQ